MNMNAGNADTGLNSSRPWRMHRSRYARNAQERSIVLYQEALDSSISLAAMGIQAVVLWSRQAGPAADVKSAVVNPTAKSEK